MQFHPLKIDTACKQFRLMKESVEPLLNDVHRMLCTPEEEKLGSGNWSAAMVLLHIVAGLAEGYNPPNTSKGARMKNAPENFTNLLNRHFPGPYFKTNTKAACDLQKRLRNPLVHLVGRTARAFNVERARCTEIELIGLVQLPTVPTEFAEPMDLRTAPPIFRPLHFYLGVRRLCECWAKDPDNKYTYPRGATASNLAPIPSPIRFGGA